MKETLQPILSFLGEQPYIQAAVIFALVLVVSKVIAILVQRAVKGLLNRAVPHLGDLASNVLRLPLAWTVFLVATSATISSLPLPTAAADIGRSLIASLMIVFWSTALVRLLRIFISTLSRRAGPQSVIRPQTQPLFDNVVVILVLGLSVYLVFQTWNIDMTAWLASAGIIGIAVGFAAKDTLANLFAGVFILADAPYKIGDYVVLESGERGKVTHIGIRSTRLLTRDDVEVTIPNSIMGNTRVVNESGGPHEKFRSRVQVSVAYGSDIDQVREVLMSVATDDPGVCEDPEPRVRFRTFGASGLDFELLCWIDNPELRGRVLDALNSAVYKRFMEAGIEIPFSKHDLYIKQMPEG